MAVAITQPAKQRRVNLNGGRTFDIFAVAFDSSYPTGGESLTAANLDLDSIELVLAPPSGGYVFQYDYTAHKLMAYYGNYDAADGPLIEVPDTTNLSTISTRILVIGEKA